MADAQRIDRGGPSNVAMTRAVADSIDRPRHQ
jgi:hypothetical protein